MTEEEFEKISQAITMLKRYLYVEEIIVPKGRYLELDGFIKDNFLLPNIHCFKTFNGVRVTPSPPVE